MVDTILDLYSKIMDTAVRMQKAEAMVADGTVIQTDTFDPHQVELLYNRIKIDIGDKWDSFEFSNSDTEDLRRIYCQLSKDIGSRYRLTGYFCVQFHALTYYRSDKRIIEIKQELARLEENAARLFVSFSSAADSALAGELQSVGLADLNTEELLARMFEDEQLHERLDQKTEQIKQTFPELSLLTSRRDVLLSELRDFVVEFYQTTPVMIDSMRLMSGEEGIVAYFDIERVTKQKKTTRKASAENSSTRTTVFDPSTVTAQDAKAIISSLEEVVGFFQQYLRAR